MVPLILSAELEDVHRPETVQRFCRIDEKGELNRGRGSQSKRGRDGG